VQIDHFVMNRGAHLSRPRRKEGWSKHRKVKSRWKLFAPNFATQSIAA
jgi:hypothetical protein